MSTVAQHTVVVTYMNNHNWLLSVNLHPYDGAHQDTCAFKVMRTKPTDRVIRRHMKHAMRHKRDARNRNYVPMSEGYFNV